MAWFKRYRSSRYYEWNLKGYKSAYKDSASWLLSHNKPARKVYQTHKDMKALRRNPEWWA